MARVVVSGYYGFGNAGDEIILSAVLNALRGHEPTVLSANPAETAREHRVAAVPRSAPQAVLGALARCDLLVSGGGGLLQDATGPGSVPYYLGIIAAARAMGRPFMVYAQGIGPLRAAWHRAGLRLLRGAAAVTVRDADSADVLRAAGVTGVEVTADAALSLPRPTPGELPAELAQAGVHPGETVLAIAPRHHPDPALTARLAAAADELATRLPARVLLVPMQFPEDTAACAAVAAVMCTTPSLLRRPVAIARYPQIFAHCHAVLGMRLHALILAALTGVPAVGLSYDLKIRAFLDEVGRGRSVLGLNAPAAEIVAGVQAVFPASATDTAALVAAVDRLRVLAGRNAEVLRGLLAGRDGRCETAPDAGAIPVRR